jgi:hypothetical protein
MEEGGQYVPTTLYGVTTMKTATINLTVRLRKLLKSLYKLLSLQFRAPTEIKIDLNGCIGVRNPAGVNFSSPPRPGQLFGNHTGSYPLYTGGSFPGSKAAGA